MLCGIAETWATGYIQLFQQRLIQCQLLCFNKFASDPLTFTSLHLTVFHLPCRPPPRACGRHSWPLSKSESSGKCRNWLFSKKTGKQRSNLATTPDSSGTSGWDGGGGGAQKMQ